MKVNYKRYFLYLLRWQLSTPILAGVLVVMASASRLSSTIVANLIGGLIFFWVDRFIFTSRALKAQWEIEENVKCFDCGDTTRGYRLVKSSNYDRTDSQPIFRCELCSKDKAAKLRTEGVKI